eukprot:scpid90335/ scgid16042/ 
MPFGNLRLPLSAAAVLLGMAAMVAISVLPGCQARAHGSPDTRERCKRSCSGFETCTQRRDTWLCIDLALENQCTLSACAAGYQCEARRDLGGKIHEECNDIDECQQNRLKCQSGYQCSNTVGSYACHNLCKEWPCEDGETCEVRTAHNKPVEVCNDINECELGSHNCTAGFQCRNRRAPEKFNCVKVESHVEDDNGEYDHDDDDENDNGDPDDLSMKCMV